MTTADIHARDVARMRRDYERARFPVPASRVRRDVLALLEDRRALLRAAEAVLAKALPYSGDPALKQAIDDFRAVVEGRA